MAIISYGVERTSLWNAIGTRLSDFARGKSGRLGKKRLLFRLLTYFFGAILATHSILEIFYDFNFRLFDLHTLPTWDFYRQQVTPFLAQPLTWIGLNLRSLHSYVALSAVGAAIWAHAEYRTGQYLFLYPFPKIQPRPGHFDMGPWSEPPVFQSPPTMISKRNLLRLVEKFALTYVFLGVIAAMVAFFAGLSTLRRWGLEIGVLILVTIGLAIEHVTAVFDDKVDQDYWNPKVRDKIIESHWRSYYKLKERVLYRTLVFPNREFRSFIRVLLDEGGRVFALVIVFLAFFAGFFSRDRF